VDSTPATEEPPRSPDTTPDPRSAWRRRVTPKMVIATLIGLAVLAGLIIGGKEAMHWLQGLADQSRTPEMLTILCIVYALLLAIPGVPGLEVGLVMMGVFQEVGILAAWLCTIVGLNLAFVAGRKLPRAKIERFLTPKNVPEDELPPFARNQHDTMTLVLERNRIGRWVLKWTGPPGGWRRYVLIAFLFNMPGNFVLGGGGGIGLFCGTSEDLRWRWYFATTVFAAGVFPLLFYGGLMTARQVI